MSFGLHDVTLSIAGRTALDDVTITVEPGRTTAVIGGDGAGKTTTARTLVGLVTPDRGEVARPGRDRVGYKPEDAGAWPDLTVMENLAFVARSYDLGRDAADRIARLLEVTRLDRAGGRLAADLSGGMRQKLAVSMAMLPRPALLVLDEPTTGLDPLSRIDVWRLVTRAAGEGAAVLVTTAYLDEAERASSVVVLDDGVVLAAGTAGSIRAGLDGTVTASDVRPAGTVTAWRRGTRWHAWWPDGATPHRDRPAGATPHADGPDGATPHGDRPDGDGPDGEPVAPDLTDVVTVAAMRRGAS